MSLAQEKPRQYPAILKAEIEQNSIVVDLEDGRRVSIPIAWFQRLNSASPEKVKNMEISPAGYGIHWPDLDEDVSIKAFIDGLT